MTLNLDKTDLKILKILQENGRITNLQLSQEIGLSPAPTLERVKKLEQRKLIRSYHAIINEEALGIGIKVVITLTLARQIENAITNFTKAISNIPEIMDCYQVTGNADFVLMAMVRDIPHFEQLISHKLGKIEEIGQMQSMVVLSRSKQSHVIPFEY